MVEHFRTEMECENVHQLMANLGQSEGESAQRYVDHVTELLDRLTAMQPDNEVFQAGMTTYLLSCLTNGASDEFRLKLKYEEPTTMEQAKRLLKKLIRYFLTPLPRRASCRLFLNHPLILPLQLDLPTIYLLHTPNCLIKIFVHLPCNLNSNPLSPKLLFPNLIPKL